jgi:predicted negative regulator of RcsB-dependent stress response
VDEFLSEKEQLEQIREWWRENGWYLIGGLALGVLILFGWNRFNSYEDAQGEAASELFVELRQAIEDDAPGDARSLLAQLRENYPGSPYTDQAGLVVAVIRMDAGQMSGASDELRYVMEETSDPELSLIARLRLARVLAQQEEYDEALATLDVESGGFSGRYSEVLGDIHVELGDLVSARAAYTAALITEESNLVDRNLVQMKLEELSSLNAATTEEVTQ